MRRITIEEARKAFESTGLKPVRGNGSGCEACVLGALHRAKGGSHAGTLFYIRSLLDDYSAEYLDGVWRGWDGVRVPPGEGEELCGFEDGQSLAKELIQ